MHHHIQKFIHDIRQHTQTALCIALSFLPESVREAFYIAWIGLTQAAANSYAIKTALMPYLYLSRIDSDDLHTDGWGLFLSTFDFIVLSIFSTLLASSATLPLAYGNYMKETNPLEKEKLRLQMIAQFSNSLCYAWFIATPFAGFSLFYSNNILTRFGNLTGYSDPRVIEIASSVLRPLALLIPFVMTGSIARMSIRSCKLYSIFLYGPPILASFLILAKITAFDLKMGLKAVLFCYIVEAIAGCALYTSYFFLKNELAPFRTRDVFYVKFLQDEQYKNLQSFSQFLKLGSATFLETSTNYFFWLFMMTQSKSFGVPSQTAFSLVLDAQWIVDLCSGANALSGAIELTDKITDPQKTARDVCKTAQISLAVSGVVGAIIPIIFLSSPNVLMWLSGNNDPNVAEKLHAIVLPMAIAVILNPINLAKSYHCRAMKNFRECAIARIFSMMLGMIAAYILAFPLGLGEVGLACGCALGMIIAQILLDRIWKKCLNTTCQEKEGDPYNSTQIISSNGLKTESPRQLVSENSSCVFYHSEANDASPTSTVHLGCQSVD